MIDNFLATFIEDCRQMALGHGHAHRIGKSLPQWPGSRLDTGRMAVFRVAGGDAAPLAKFLEIIESDLVAGQEKQAVKQHGGMAARQHKTVPIHPIRVFGVVL